MNDTTKPSIVSNPALFDDIKEKIKGDIKIGENIDINPTFSPKDVMKNEEVMNDETMKNYMNSMQNIFGNLCEIIGETEKKENINTTKVSNIFDNITDTLETIVGKDDTMFKNLKKDIKKMKKEIKTEEKKKKKKKKKKSNESVKETSDLDID